MHTCIKKLVKKNRRRGRPRELTADGRRRRGAGARTDGDGEVQRGGHDVEVRQRRGRTAASRCGRGADGRTATSRGRGARTDGDGELRQPGGVVVRRRREEWMIWGKIRKCCIYRRHL
jgi:hypothetical protein